MVTNVEFVFRDPQGGPPDCGDRLVFAGFPRNGVAFTFSPIVGDSLPGFFFELPDTTLPLGPDLLVDSGGIRGGPSESFQMIWRDEDWIGTIRRFEGPEAIHADVVALDRMLRSFRVRGAARWVEGRTMSLGSVEVSFLRPESWTFAGYPHAIVIDAPTPILRLRSPGIRGDGCKLIGEPWLTALGVGRFEPYGVEIMVSDASDSWGPRDLPTRPATFSLDDASSRRSVTCGDASIRVLTFGFREAGKPIFIHVLGSDAVYRKQPEMLLHIVNSIRIEKS